MIKMKSTLLVLLSLLLYSLFTNNAFTSAAEVPSPVLDTAGKKLRAGSLYYMAFPGSGGGLLLEKTSNKTCPLGLVQGQNISEEQGIPLAFFPVNSKKGVIRVSTDLNIVFTNKIIGCPQSKVWLLDRYDPVTGKYFLTTGGVQGNPGPTTIRNWFKIEKFGYGYKLVYCPTVCSYCKVMCKDVGIFVQNGKRRLALSDVPLKVVFEEV